MSESTVNLSRNLQDIAKKLDKNIEDAAGEHIAFTLIVFTEGRASYVSTCLREDSIKEMKHLIELWENDMPDIMAHDVI